AAAKPAPLIIVERAGGGTDNCSNEQLEHESQPRRLLLHDRRCDSGRGCCCHVAATFLAFQHIDAYVALRKQQLSWASPILLKAVGRGLCGKLLAALATESLT
ncbi:unnamed protein product, partial [Effrenium voratum]